MLLQLFAIPLEDEVAAQCYYSYLLAICILTIFEFGSIFQQA